VAKAKEKHQCCATHYKNCWHPGVQCENNAKIERDGKWYCGTHDPAKQEAKLLKWENARKAKEANWALQKRRQKCTARMLSMAHLITRALRGVASKEEANAVQGDWSSLVTEAVSCGLITEESQ
jgi:hypothetical protein